MKIDSPEIGYKSPVFIIAELSANHNQSYDIAVETIKAAKDAGADAIKLQTYTADTITIDSDREEFTIKHGTIWDGRKLYDLYKQAYTPWEWQPKLQKLAEELNLIFFSTPSDKTSTDFLLELNVPLYKISSHSISDIPMIEYVASKGKPVIISTGIATLIDIEEAVNACHRMNNHDVIILKCTSAYPAPIEDANLLTIPDMREKFGKTVGLSDHTLTNTSAIAAVALGAKVIEKHIILDRNMGGPDAQFSLEPNEFRDLVQSVRETELSLGSVTYELTEKMKESRKLSRSLFVVKNIKNGDKFTEDNVRSIKPADGLHPKHLPEILGGVASRDIEKGTPFNWDLIQ